MTVSPLVLRDNGKKSWRGNILDRPESIMGQKDGLSMRIFSEVC